MIAIGNEEALYLLEFFDRRNLKREIEQLQKKTKCEITSGSTATTHLIENELQRYFKNELQKFITPIHLLGTTFQNSVWEELKKISFRSTCSYSDIAKKISRPTAFRAVAMANSMNQLAIIVPCHRVINSNHTLGGYSAGIMRKQWLLNHEKALHG